jgi:hypothetical protein
MLADEGSRFAAIRLAGLIGRRPVVGPVNPWRISVSSGLFSATAKRRVIGDLPEKAIGTVFGNRAKTLFNQVCTGAQLGG